MEGNGQNDHESRLNRLEAATELMIRDNEEFRERFRLMQDAHQDFEKEHKRLLIAQVVMQDKLEEIRDLVREIGEKLNGLIDWSNQVHRDNDERFRRLEREALIMEADGPKDNESRLDRLDLVRERMLRDNEEFRAHHERIRAGQDEFRREYVKLEESLARLDRKLGQGAKGERSLSEKVREIGENLDRLIAYSEQTRRENEVRFRRLEEKH